MPPEKFVDLHFPRAGVDVSAAYGKQPARPDYRGQYARTCPSGINVRAYDPTLDRSRGGSRCGLSKHLPAAVSGWIVQQLDTIVSVPAMQQSNSGRVVTLISVQQGNVYAANAGDAAWTTPANNTGDTPPLNYNGLMFSAPNQQKLWFADGTNWVYFNPTDTSVNRWSPNTVDLDGNAITSALPVDSSGNTPRLICTWRGRTVLSGLIDDPQNWFMSAVNDPRNFDYGPLSTTPLQAVAGNNGPQGLIGDVCTALIPYTDDVLIFGGDSSVWMFRGDPMNGGSIDKVTAAIGIAWGQAWCQDPYGTIYFVSNRMGVYSFTPGQQPQRISQPIEKLLSTIDSGENAIRLIWDDRFQGVHVFITPIEAPGSATHYFWEQRTGGWWQDTFANTNHNPLCCVTFDGNQPTDRVALIGSWDGYVRSIDPTAADDDGTAIGASVVIGPMLMAELDDLKLYDLQAVLGESSGVVDYAVYTGTTAEKALASTPVSTGQWQAGRNHNTYVGRAGHAIYVKLSGSRWQMETIRARLRPQGKVRQRSKY